MDIPPDRSHGRPIAFAYLTISEKANDQALVGKDRVRVLTLAKCEPLVPVGRIFSLLTSYPPTPRSTDVVAVHMSWGVFNSPG